MTTTADVLAVASNLSKPQMAALEAALGCSISRVEFAAADFFVLEPRHGEDLTAEQVECIKDRVRQGATLMVGLNAWRQLSSMRLGEVAGDYLADA